MAGGLCCRLADAGLSVCRRGKEGGPPPGVVVLSVVARYPWVMVCRGWLGGGDPAAIRRYLISH